MIIMKSIIRVRLEYLKPFNNVQRSNLGSFKNVINKTCLQTIYIYIYIYMCVYIYIYMCVCVCINRI